MALCVTLPNIWYTQILKELEYHSDSGRTHETTTPIGIGGESGGRFKNTYELLNLRALKISMLHKNHIFQCMGKIFCVEFQRVPLKFHTKYLAHTSKDVDLFTGENLRALRFKST